MPRPDLTAMSLAMAGALAILALSACAHYPVNASRDRVGDTPGYRFEDLAHEGNSDALFLCLTFSRGGTRAAALAYGVMEELRRTPVGDGRRSVLDEVDCISSVSGGSFTAAYYGLFRDRTFEDFRSKFLERNVERALFWGLLNPYNWIRLASPWFGRIDLAAEFYVEEIFEQRTFAALLAQGRPFIILNATNLEAGSRFDFTRQHFDAMGSDLEAYPVARAVAASSAFPFLLSPVSLKNYPTPADYRPPPWYEGGLAALHVERRRYVAAENLKYYLEERADGKAHPFIHLMDGGLADNIGTRAIQDAYARGFIRTKLNNKEITKLVIIVVNAATDPQEKLSRRESPPHLPTVAYKTSTVSMDNYSVESIALITEHLKQRLQAQKVLEGCRRHLKRTCPAAPSPPTFGTTLDPYVMEVSFKGAATLDGEDPAYYLNLPTSFRLEAGQVERLVQVGPKLLRALPQYQCLLAVLEAEAQGAPRPETCPLGAGIFGPEED